jgi:tyrosyl-tRNA synthetase
MELAARFTVRQVLEREDFEARYRAGKPISIHEIFYILMQAWDSVMVRADVELGGTEQKFNFLAARDLQKQLGQEPQVAITVPILVGTDGTRRMSKSTGNYVGVAEPPAEQFGKVMSIPDATMAQWFALISGLPPAEQARWLAPDVNPRDAKEALGKAIVARYHGPAAADAAAEGFRKQFAGGELPADIPDHALAGAPGTIVELIVATKCAPSKSEARRLVEQGGVAIIRGDTSERVADVAATPALRDGDILKVGKRRYVRLRVG